jgi:hypothetical protein
VACSTSTTQEKTSSPKDDRPVSPSHRGLDFVNEDIGAFRAVTSDLSATASLSARIARRSTECTQNSGGEYGDDGKWYSEADWAKWNAENLITAQARQEKVVEVPEVQIFDTVVPVPAASSAPPTVLAEADAFETDPAVLLREVLKAAELELARKDVELRIMQTFTTGGLKSLHKEHQKLVQDTRDLSEQKQALSEDMALMQQRACECEARATELEQRLSRRAAPPRQSPAALMTALATSDSPRATTPGSPAGWRAKAAFLEEELRAKADLVGRLRQRELWLEQQIRRQVDVNGTPLEVLLHEVCALRAGADRIMRQEAPRVLQLSEAAATSVMKSNDGVFGSAGMSTLPRYDFSAAIPGRIVQSVNLVDAGAANHLAESMLRSAMDANAKRGAEMVSYPPFGPGVHVV